MGVACEESQGSLAPSPIGTRYLGVPVYSDALNAYPERFVRSFKEECLNRMIFVGQASLRRAVDEYMTHYHQERNHQGLDYALIREKTWETSKDARVGRKQRRGGMLNYYFRAEA